MEPLDSITHATDALVGDKPLCKGGLGTRKLDSSATNKADSVLPAGVLSEPTDSDIKCTCNGKLPAPSN